MEHVQDQHRYESAPLHRSPERGQLFAEYRQGIEERKTRLEEANGREGAALNSIKEKWAAKRREIEKMNIAKRNRRNLLHLARKHEAEELAKAKLQFQAPREAVRQEIPFTSWNGFLRHKAEQGNETALAVLRSFKETAEAEREAQPAPQKDWSQHGWEQFQGRAALKVEQVAQERAVLESVSISGKGKTRLLAVLRMEQLAQQELREGEGRNGPTIGSTAAVIAGFQHSIDSKGTVIFTLPGGGRIMDTGKELFFSAHNEAAETVALRYAQKKWGKRIQRDGNRIFREVAREIRRDMAR